MCPDLTFVPSLCSLTTPQTACVVVEARGLAPSVHTHFTEALFCAHEEEMFPAHSAGPGFFLMMFKWFDPVL